MKTSPPPGDGSGIADNRAVEEPCTGGAIELGTKATKELDTGASEEVGAGASEELTPDLRLLQKVKAKIQNKEEKLSATRT